MKRTGIILLSILFLQGIPFGSASSWACNKGDDVHLETLLKEKKYTEAETWALARVKKQPDRPDNHLALASVYLHQAAQETLQFNSEALGIPAGGTGTAHITPGNLEQVFQSRMTIAPEHGDKASAILEAVVQRWPDQRQAHFCLLDLLQKSRKHPELLRAADRMAQALKHEGSLIVDELHHYALNYFKENRFQHAADLYEVAIRHFPKSGKLLSSSGVVRIKLGHLDEGADYFKRAYQQSPKDPIILCNLGEVSLYQQQFKRAQKYLNLCLKEAPRRISVYFDLAVIAMADGPRASIPAWEQYLKKNETTPDDPSWAQLGQQILEMNKARATPEAIESLSTQFLQNGSQKLAIPLISWLIQQNPSEPVYRFLLAGAYDKQGFTRQARQQAMQTEQLLLKQPDHQRLKISDVRFELGRLAYALQIWDESAGYLEKVLKANPKTPNLQYMLGLVETQRGRKDTARHYFQDCLDQPNNAQYVAYCRQNLKSSK